MGVLNIAPSQSSSSTSWSRLAEIQHQLDEISRSQSATLESAIVLEHDDVCMQNAYICIYIYNYILWMRTQDVCEPTTMMYLQIQHS